MLRVALLPGVYLSWTLADVPTITLSNGVEMPTIGAGSFQYNDTEAEYSISTALDVGFRLVDTALGYWNQQGVGRALQAAVDRGLARDAVFVETKIQGCLTANDTLNPFHCYDNARRNLESDLKLLNVSYVDLVLLHSPPMPAYVTRMCNNYLGGCSMIRSEWRALEEFYKAGKARAIGVSNYCPSCFSCLKDAEIQPMVNQVMFHLGMGIDPSNILSYDRDHGIVTQAYSTLGNNPLTGSGPMKDIISGELTTRIAAKHNVSTVQVALKWIVQKGVPAITKSHSAAHLQQDLDLWSWDLDEEDVDELDAWRLPFWTNFSSFACNWMEELALV